MAVFQVDIEKRLVGERWTNRYFVDAETIAAAHVTANVIVDTERTVHGSAVEFVTVRTSTVTEGDNVYISEPLFGFGEVSLTAYLPLFCVVRVLFGGTGGRPYYKLYRGCLEEANVSGSVLEAGVTLAFVELCASLSGLITTGLGDTLATGVVDPRIAMRQLRRGRRRKTTPILPT